MADTRLPFDEMPKTLATSNVVVCFPEDETPSSSPTAGLKPGSTMAPRSIDFLWKEARTQFLDRLPSRQRQHEEAFLDDTTLEDTLQSLSAAKDKAEEAYGTKFKGRPAEIKLSRALNRLEFILRFGDAAMKFAPETVSCVWAAFRLVASGVIQDFDSCQFLVDAVDQMSDILLVCEVYAKRQLFQLPDSSDEACLMADKVLEKIPPLLALVLRFAYETRRLVIDKRRFSRMFAVMFGGAQELKDIFKDAEAKRDELDRAAGIAVHEAVIQLLQATNQDTDTIIKYLDGLELAKEALLVVATKMEQKNEEISENVQEIRLEQLREKEVKERQSLDNELRGQVNWLQRDGLTALHEPSKVMREHLGRRYPGTCEWAITDRRFLSWLQPGRTNSSKPLLWLAGEAGFGKSILMSFIMSHLEQQEPSPVSEGRPVVLRFFCKLGDDSSQKGSRVIAHLLCQLLHLAELEDSLDIKKRCVELGRELKTNMVSNEAQINLGRVLLLVELAKAFKRRVYLLIDGLDECEDRDGGLLASLVRIAEAACDIRLLVSSRPLHDIHQEFARHDPPKIDLEQDLTEKDVEAYIAGSLRTISRFDQSKRRKATAQIAIKAAGMFRYANLAVEGLKSPAALRKPFKQLMDQLPDGLTELYEQELRALESAKREILMVALRWVVCGEGPISLDLIADELEGKYLNECSDSETEEDDMEDDNREIEDVDISREFSGGLALSTRDGQERDCIRHLKSAGRNFLRIDDSGIVTVQHTSVRDFILSKSETAVTNRADALCARCQERLEPLPTAEAGPKHGHLIMALRCLKLLNCPGFQSEFLPLSVLEQHRNELVLLARGDAESDADSVVQSCEPTNAKERTQTGEEQSQENDVSGHLYISRTKKPPTSSTARVDYSKDKALRYELTHWHYHVRAAESLWKKDERDTKEWLGLYEQIERFLNDPQAAHTWHKLIDVWEDKPDEQGILREFVPFDLPIHMASQYGILHYIHGYLESGGAIDVENENGCTPLHLACSDKRGHAAVRLLVEHGADVNRRCHAYDHTPLIHLAWEGGSAALVRFLLDHGADPRETEDDLTPLQSAICAGNLETITAILDYCRVDLIDPERDDLNFVLNFTVVSDEVIELLLAKGADPNHRGPHGNFPLCRAAERGNTEVVKMLLEAGAEVDKQDCDSGATALHHALELSATDLVNLLLDHGASITAKDKHSRNAVWHAVNGGRHQQVILAKLLGMVHNNPDAESSPNEPPDNADQNRTPVAQADCNGNTPLHLAANQGDAGIARWLIYLGADVLSTNSAGNSVLDVAVHGWSTCGLRKKANYINTLHLLLDHHVPILPSLMPELLCLAAEYGAAGICRRVVSLVGSHTQLAQLTDKHGWTPLMMALYHRNHKMVRFLRALDWESESNSLDVIADGEHGHRPSGWRVIEEKWDYGRDEHGFLKISAASPELTDHPMPFGASRYYWEVEVVEAGVEAEISFGIASEWRQAGFAYSASERRCLYQSQDGMVWGATRPDLRGIPSFYPISGPKYGQGDTVGCGVDFVNGAIFFTRNGVLLGDATRQFFPCRLFPAVRIYGGTVKIKANFGTDPAKTFMYDPNQYETETESPTGFVEMLLDA